MIFRGLRRIPDDEIPMARGLLASLQGGSDEPQLCAVRGDRIA